MYNLNIQYQLKYSVTTPACGFIPDDIYEVIITEADIAGYIITSKYNVSKDEDIDIQIYLSSENSVVRYFTEVE